jgi:regulator of RNase E activity RraA
VFVDGPLDTLTIHSGWDRPAPEIVDRLAVAPAANVADVFDRLLVMDGAIGPVTPVRTRLCGTALPVLTRAGDNLAVHRALDEARPGDVLVISGQADPSRALIGDLIGEIMRARKVRGAIVDGAARDAAELARQGLAVFARGLTPAGPFKNGPGVIGRTIACGGVVVGPGDVVVADEDGVAVVPAERAAWAADRIDEVIARENELRAAIVSAG